MPNHFHIIVRAIVAGLLLCASVGPVGAKPPEFVGSETCAQCHQGQFAAWRDSHHGWAWRRPTPTSVLGDFADAQFGHQGVEYRFQREDDDFFIQADGPNGRLKRYPVHSTVGVEPLQQYLIETEPGRLQTLDLAWDTEQRRWYHLYPGEDTSAGNGLHWTASYKNWNGRCAECHATDYRKGFDPRADRYQSTQAEMGVGCEACHGPASAHLVWAAQPSAFMPKDWPGLNPWGLTEVFDAQDPGAEINACATCHSRREPLGADSPPVGAAFDDHYRLALLRDGLYFADGQIDDEVYVLGSFLQSKMHARGVRCTNCHDAHSYRLKLPGNQVCTQCHNPAGNPAFPSLPKADYDTPEHHFHPPESEGAACVDCHMPERNYMGVDGRRDHGFRIPRPALSRRIGSPDVCTGCHIGKTYEWAQAELDQRFPQGRHGEAHFGDWFAEPSQHLAELTDLAGDSAVPDIIRASAIQHLSARLPTDQRVGLASLLQDDSAWVRGAAVGLLRAIEPVQRIELLAPVLRDARLSVRIEAAKAFLDVRPRALPQKWRAALRQAMHEYQQSLQAKADYPETQMAIGGVALTLRNLPAASQAFARATEQDPQLVDAWLMRARIQAAQGHETEVRALLLKALAANPTDAELRQALNELDQRASD